MASLAKNFGGLSLNGSRNGSRTTRTTETVTETTETVTTVKKQLRHYVLLFDLSGSMAGGKIQAMCAQFQQFKNVVLKEEDYISVISFNSNVRVLAECLQVVDVDFDHLINEISVASGRTALYDAIFKGIEVAQAFTQHTVTTSLKHISEGGTKKDVVTELVAFTDGKDSGSSKTLEEVKTRVASPGVSHFNMIALVVGTEGIPAMQAICEGPQHAHLIAEESCDADAIRTVFGRMTKIMKTKVTTVTRTVDSSSGPRRVLANKICPKFGKKCKFGNECTHSADGPVPMVTVKMAVGESGRFKICPRFGKNCKFGNQCTHSGGGGGGGHGGRGGRGGGGGGGGFSYPAAKRNCIAPGCGNKVGANHDLCKTCNDKLSGSTPYRMDVPAAQRMCEGCHRSRVGPGYSLCKRCNGGGGGSGGGRRGNGRGSGGGGSGPTFGTPY